MFPLPETEESAIEFIKFLRKRGVKIYWHSGIKRLVINPRKHIEGLGLIQGFGPSVAKHLTEILKIKTKGDWERIREKVEIKGRDVINT